MTHATQLSARDSALLVIDVQEKLMTKIPAADALVRDIAFLIDVARLLDVEVAATEQYTRGLGPTVRRWRSACRRGPTRSRSARVPCRTLSKACVRARRTKVELTGIEAHVCVLHTALDLLAANFQVYLAVDAVASRYAVDRQTALQRLDRAGAILTTVETCAFEWMGGSQHPRFKQVSTLVQERMKTIA